MPLLVDEAMAHAWSRLSSIRLSMFTLRVMENWRGLVDDFEKMLILIAVAAINGEKFTRGAEIDHELWNVRIQFPDDLVRSCNISSIAAATGFNRETTRRKVNELIEAGLLDRSHRGLLRYKPGSIHGEDMLLLVRRQLDVIVRLTNDLLRDGVVAVD
jgi:hypothetical protein